MSTLQIFLISISFLFAASIVVLRIFVRRDYLKFQHLSIPTAVLQVAVFFVFGGYPAIYLPQDWPISYVHLSIQVVGWLSIACGLAVLFAAMFRLGIIRSMGLRTGEIADANFYKASRNPQVLGCGLYVIGFLILWPSLYALVWAALLIVVLHEMVLTEEEHLQKTFGEKYEWYCSIVPRYLGLPRISG
jgi:protein-S-isoprenylcysteine O-methyltransferase Ste14